MVSPPQTAYAVTCDGDNVGTQGTDNADATNVACGDNADADGGDAIAIGHEAEADGAAAIAIGGDEDNGGAGAQALSRQSIAIGGDATVDSTAVGAIAPVWQQPLENWERMLRLNLTGTFLCCRAIVPTMIDAGYGRIVNIASNAGKVGTRNNAGYAAAKAGVISLTKSLAKETAQTGVLVNAIAPGGTNTELFDDLSAEYRAAIVDGMELGRLLEPPEIAALAAWLASEDCSFSTGAVFDISGGRADY